MVHAGGRPRTWTDLAALEAAITKYLETTFAADKAPTISGLALALNFESRRSIQDYANRNDEFSAPIKRALLAITDYWEGKLDKAQCVGAIFWLKDAGMKDTVTVEGQITLSDVLRGMGQSQAQAEADTE